MIDEPGTELSLPGFMYDEDVKMAKKGIKILGMIILALRSFKRLG